MNFRRTASLTIFDFSEISLMVFRLESKYELTIVSGCCKLPSAEGMTFLGGTRPDKLVRGLAKRRVAQRRDFRPLLVTLVSFGLEWSIPMRSLSWMAPLVVCTGCQLLHVDWQGSVELNRILDEEIYAGLLDLYPEQATRHGVFSGLLRGSTHTWQRVKNHCPCGKRLAVKCHPAACGSRSKFATPHHRRDKNIYNQQKSARAQPVHCQDRPCVASQKWA